MEKIISLCYRCEHRAEFLEGGRRPRYECGEVATAKCSCYIYQPVKPVVVERNDVDHEEKDPRPLAPGMLSCRFHAVRVAGVMLRNQYNDIDEQAIFYWFPREEKTSGNWTEKEGM